MKPTALTHRQKLEALSNRFYNRIDNPWQPKKGDYYTTPRADLQLYQIIDEDEEYFYTVYCHVPDSPVAKWKKEEFLKDFGINRLQVYPHIFTIAD